jgi:hypothetical protein
MSKRKWTWAAAASATLAGAAAAVVIVGASPARSDDDYEVHTPPRDFGALRTALANWDDDSAREDALAAYLGEESGASMLAPCSDPTYVENQ